MDALFGLVDLTSTRTGVSCRLGGALLGTQIGFPQSGQSIVMPAPASSTTRCFPQLSHAKEMSIDHVFLPSTNGVPSEETVTAFRMVAS